MPLHLTKVAFGVTTLDHLAERMAARAAADELFLTTRYQPKRHAEIAGQGSLYWIIKHQLVARSAITHFGDAPEGRIAIHLAAPLILVGARRKRAHQGWRYLEDADVPPDLGGGDTDGLAAMPPVLQGTLADLALI
ncbi:MAG: DUF1489 domain-containing protein [Pseudomonadota bacterium]